ENNKRVRRLDGADEDRRRRGTFRRHYYRPSHAAYERTRFGASAAGAPVHGQDYRPLGISDEGEHPGLRGIGGGHDARETLRCRRASARDGSPHEKALCAAHSAGVNSGTVAIIFGSYPSAHQSLITTVRRSPDSVPLLPSLYCAI